MEEGRVICGSDSIEYVDTGTKACILEVNAKRHAW